MWLFIKRSRCLALVAVFLVVAVIFTGIYLYTLKTDAEEVFYPQNIKNGPTLVIDPGHGGEDGGAVSLSGAYESDINLSIALKLDKILGLYGIAPVMTRDSDEIEYPENAKTVADRKRADIKKRVNLINSIQNAVLISIHQNKYTGEGPFGAQVLYANTDGSLEFGEYMQSVLISSLNPENYRKATQISRDIYLMNNIVCPALLIECGFLSNPTEEALLKTDRYQTKTASAIAAGYLQSYKSLDRG